MDSLPQQHSLVRIPADEEGWAHVSEFASGLSPLGSVDEDKLRLFQVYSPEDIQDHKQQHGEENCWSCSSGSRSKSISCEDCGFALCSECRSTKDTRCLCPSSNFGIAFCDFDRSPDHQYDGEYKPLTQINQEGELLSILSMLDLKCAKKQQLNKRVLERIEKFKECGLLNCGKPGSTRCARCKHIFYCSRECQQADWKRHKRMDCGRALAPSEVPFLDEELKQVLFDILGGKGLRKWWSQSSLSFVDVILAWVSYLRQELASSESE